MCSFDREIRKCLLYDTCKDNIPSLENNGDGKNIKDDCGLWLGFDDAWHSAFTEERSEDKETYLTSKDRTPSREIQKVIDRKLS